MIRRFPSGRFRPLSPVEAVPLLVCEPKSERISKGNRTRHARYRAAVLEGMEMLRLEVAMRKGWHVG